jgi:hypothetical protein
MSKMLAWSVGIGVLVTVLLSVWAYGAKDDTWDFRGSVRSLQSLDAEVRLLPASTTFPGLTSSFISNEAENIQDEARREGESVRTLTLPPNYRGDQLNAAESADSVASSSEALK